MTKPRLQPITLTLGACEPAPISAFLFEDGQCTVLIGNRALRRHPERFREAWEPIGPKLLGPDWRELEPESIPWVDQWGKLEALYYNERFFSFLCPHFEDWRQERVNYLRSRDKNRAAYILSRCDSEDSLRAAIENASDIRVPQWGSDASNLRGCLWDWWRLQDLPFSG